MLAAMISDAHLTGLDDPNQARLVQLLDGLDAPRLFLLGDLFHFWWSHRGHRPQQFEPFLDALDRQLAAGTRVTYIPGNHDFALRHFEERGVVVTSSVRCLLGGLRYHLLHGDEADSSTGYALTRRVLRGPAFAVAMRMARPALARRIGLALAGASHTAHTNDALVEAQKRLADELLATSEVVVMGHSHAPGRHDRPGGTYVNLGDFVHHHTWLAVTEDGPELRSA